MIELKHLSKTYESSAGRVEALKDINLTISDGEIFCVIGLSGAGKSTLVRCINLLERPTEGEVWIDGQELTVAGRKNAEWFFREYQGFATGRADPATGQADTATGQADPA